MPITIPTPEQFFLEKGLYEHINLGDPDYDTAQQIYELEFFNGAIRTYCPDCMQESTFRTDLIKDETINTLTKLNVLDYKNGVGQILKLKTPKEVDHYLFGDDYKNYAFANKTFTLEFYCTHNHKHRIFYIFNITNKIIQKIGQFPSIADSMEGEIKEYKKILEKELDKEKSQEFSKAIGLFSHGVGIGSFVYLRRIFEAFIYKAKDQALEESTITEDEFHNKRMAERISLLSNYLPEIIVEHKELYGVVSKGIHELSEDECKKYFATIKAGIELILDEKIAKRKAEEKRLKFQQEISQAQQEINA